VLISTKTTLPTGDGPNDAGSSRVRLIAACEAAQLRQSLGAGGWSLGADQVAQLDAASAVTAPYPYFPYRRQEGYARLDPPLV